MNGRQERLSAIKDEVELLVIGGGITGAGIALDAQSRGINTVLVEMQDFGAGTSSRSTKLVHGGLRYLKQLEVQLVAEVGKERAIVYENGPHVTTPEWMMLPIIKGGTYGKLASSVGLAVYDRLAGVKKSERRQMLNKEETLRKEPLLRKEGLKGSGYYVEYRTDDARLTLEVMKKAVEYGAEVFNYVKVTELLYENGKVNGVKVRDQISGEEYTLRAKKIVNATGPWVDELREMDGSKHGKTLHWTKGVHIVVDGGRFPLRQAIYFDTEDGRMVFAIPRDGKTYIGTTDTDYRDDLVHPRVTETDRDYLISAVNSMFPEVKLTQADVETFWAGVRPLIHEEGKSPSEISRKDEIFHSKSGLITIAGGKLTGYRKMAEKVVNLVAKELQQETGKTFAACHTDRIPISGGDVGGSAGFEAFVKEKTKQGVELGFSEQQAGWLTRLYGSNVDHVYQWSTADGKAAAKRYGIPLELYASLMYGLQHEMVQTPVDYLLRRTGAMLFDIAWVKRWQAGVVDLMADHCAWDEQTRMRREQELEQEIRYVTEVVSD
ncbi:glycerol-3-phosphate dehydrogenase/oxidase [Laceyella sacchari]|uniref:Glycerol-3-phosphate dehydrogenase n=1 Tax=Laceyella sacchari TaxID=37482 RepID=A0ABY5U2T9_LACSH|nr:glycerol-3-phosphate dehydrogenase/oxidase [Laceyella sacchari]UWE03956.1 glycerol-3-phosphate dehydrogenase/oxidase [Laceyella sacchari]